MGERAPVEELNRLLSDEVAFSVFLSGLSQVKVRPSHAVASTACGAGLRFRFSPL